MDRPSKSKTAEKTREDMEFRAAGRRSETKESCMKLNQIRQLGREAECEMMQRDDIIHEKM